MKKKSGLPYIIYITLFTVVLATAAFLWFGNKEAGEAVKAFKESGGEIIVIFDRQLEQEALNAFTDSLSTPVEVVRHLEDYALISVKESSDYNLVFQQLQNNPLVKNVQANGKISGLKFTNDTYSDTQWALNNTGRYFTYYDSRDEMPSTADVDMNIPEAWGYMRAWELGQREVVIAVIDTGIDYKHPELAEHIWENEGEIPEDGLDNDNNGYVDDIHGWDFYNDDATICHYKYDEEQKINVADPEDNDDHGTHVAGIISATSNNETGVAGVASNVKIKIMALKINGGPDGTGSISSAVEAIKYATMMGADICNLSWGTRQYTSALKEVMTVSDMLFVAAAGNTGDDNNEKPIYPASLGLPNLISVTFVDADGELTRLSNYGNRSVDIAAPGDDIYSTVVGSYSTLSGSSMAAPQVSAIAALLYSYEDHIYPANVKDLILQNTKAFPDLARKLINPGIPDAFQIVSAASEGLRKDEESPVIELNTVYDKGNISIPVKISETGGSSIRVVKWLSGEREITDFRHGMDGTLVIDNQVNMDKAGIYTFYAADFAGNETSLVYEVKEDMIPPKITSSYTVSSTYKTRTITVKVTDTLSNVKRVKYMSGSRNATDFLPAGAGTEITLKEGKGTFKVKKDGIYSIYAIDYRGNTIVKQINIKTIKATQLKLSRSSKTMTEGDQYTLKTFIKPANTTDKIIFTSSNENIATVSSNGIINALKTGKAYITAKTYSGKTAIFEVIVK